MAQDWNPPETDAVNATLIPRKRRMERIALGTSPRDSLSTGYADFRHFPLTRAVFISIRKADFSHARSPKNQHGVDQGISLSSITCTDVIFDRARVFHTLDGQFTDCSFKGVGTERCGVTGTFTDCDFTGTSFRNAHFKANFVRCRFIDCNLHLASWPSSFEDCEFSGARIDDIFSDIREVATASERVTFAVVGSSVFPGETRHY